MITPDRPKALQSYLRNDSDLKKLGVNRVGFLKVATGDGPAIVFNEGGWNAIESANISYEKGIDIFPILIDVVVKYKDYKKGYDIRNQIRRKIGKFDGKLTNDWEGMIVFKQVLAPSYNHETDEILFGSVYLLKQNFDYTPQPEPTPVQEEVLDENSDNNANNTNQELTEQSDSNS